MGMRILFVNRMASLVRGGGETFDLEIARYLRELGGQTALLSGLPLLGRARVPVVGQVSHTLRSPYWGWFPWDKVRGGWRLRWADFQQFERRAVRWAVQRSDQFDLIQVCELPTFVAAWKQCGQTQPVVMRLTAPDYYDPEGALGKADAVIASGTSVGKLREGARLDCVDIPNGVEVDRFRPQTTRFRAEQGIGDDEFVVLAVGRFQAVKNHAMLIDGFARFHKLQPQSRLVLAGSGPLQGGIRQACRAKGVADRVLFLGEVPYEELPAVYAAADVKTITSDYESFCFAALEAMATRLPLVVTDTDWVPRLIDHGKGGLVVPRGDGVALCEALQTLAKNRELRLAMGAWNRAAAEARHSWSASAERLWDLYRGLLGVDPSGDGVVVRPNEALAAV